MVASAKPARKAPARPRRVHSTSAPTTVEPAENGLVDQMRAMAGKVLDAGAATVGAASSLKAAAGVARALSRGKPMEAAADVLKAVMPGLSEPGVWARTGAALKRLRTAAGLTVTEVGTAINLKDPSLIEAWETGRIAVPFELILRLAAVLGRNDPIGFVMKFTREREFANIYRADDEARKLSDEEFAEVLTFTRAAFEMAMAFRGRKPGARRATAKT